MIIRTLTNKPTAPKKFATFYCARSIQRIQAEAGHIQPTYGFFKAFSGPRTPIQRKRYHSVYQRQFYPKSRFGLMATLKTTPVTQSLAECVSLKLA